MRAIIFVNGTVDDYTLLAHWVGEDDYLIGADGGTNHCLAIGKIPHLIVGDLDSLDSDEIERLATLGVQIERHPIVKDKTDLELAVDRAVLEGADELLLLGALGGRLDQAVANLLLLAKEDWPIPIKLADGKQLAQIVRGGEKLILNDTPGSTVSAIALSEQVTGITYTGLEYPLVDATLDLGSTRGVSNLLVGTLATIEVKTGILLVTQESCSADYAG